MFQVVAGHLFCRRLIIGRPRRGIFGRSALVTATWVFTLATATWALALATVAGIFALATVTWIFALAAVAGVLALALAGWHDPIGPSLSVGHRSQANYE
jgi:hypothetical protein